MYRYDAVGSSERVAAACSGEGEKMIQPILDELTNMEEDESLWEIAGEGENAFISTTMKQLSPSKLNLKGEVINNSIDAMVSLEEPKNGLCVDLDCDKACEVVVRAFRAAAEREISVGDGIDVWILKRKEDLMSRFGAPMDDTNSYLIEKHRFALPTH